MLQEINGTPYLLADKKNKVVATIEVIEVIGDINPYAVLRMHPKEKTIASQSSSLSSIYDRSNIANNFWQNAANNGLVEVDFSGGILTLTAFIDGSKVNSSELNWTITATADQIDRNNTNQGEVWQQDVLLIDTREFNEDNPLLPERPFSTCCYERLVFGDTTTTNQFNNDINSFYYITNLLNDNKVIKLFKNNVEVADLDENAGLGEYRKITRNSNIVYIYTLHWREVLISFGAGCYHVEFMSKKSDTFTLKQYHKNFADKTVRILFTLNNTVGDKFQAIKNDFNDLNIVDSVRFRKAMFGFPTFPIEEEKMRLDSGYEKTSFRSFQEKYQLKIGELPIQLHNLFKYRILLSEEIIITDYNSQNNGGRFTNISVKPDGEYSPNYDSPK
ncbi:MAG: hypothetical protein WD512_06695, partial [Candidatus Paceibacterota bacterium]